MSKKLVFFYIFVILIVCIGIGYYLYPVSRESTDNSATIMNTILQGRDLTKINPQGAVALLQSIAKEARTPSDMAAAYFNLGIAEFSAGQVASGTDVLKTVSTNEAYPALYRRAAITSLLRYYLGTADLDFALHSLFTGPQWSAFMNGKPSTAEGADLAMQDAYLWALSLDSSPTSFIVSYRLANWYSQNLLATSSETAKKEDQIKTLQYLALGDKAYAQASAIDTNASKNPKQPLPYDLSVRASGLTLKARALGNLYLADASSSISVASTSDIFKNALALYASDTGSSSEDMAIPLYTRLYYAGFLATVDPTTYKSSIESILDPFFNAHLKDNYFFTEFLSNLAKKDLYPSITWGYTKDTLVRLAKDDPTFKSFLLSAGWSSSDFE